MRQVLGWGWGAVSHLVFLKPDFLHTWGYTLALGQRHT